MSAVPMVCYLPGCRPPWCGPCRAWVDSLGLTVKERPSKPHPDQLELFADSPSEAAR